MILTNIAYCPAKRGKDLGYAYNQFMDRLHYGDWGCFLDHDAMFTTYNWYPQLEQIIYKNPNIGCLTGMTNRVGQSYQTIEVDTENHDIRYHRKIGLGVQQEFGNRVLDITNEAHFSGVIILISKMAWDVVPFVEGSAFATNNQLHKDLVENGMNVGLMRGVYVYHWYRAKL